MISISKIKKEIEDLFDQSFLISQEQENNFWLSSYILILRVDFDELIKHQNKWLFSDKNDADELKEYLKDFSKKFITALAFYWEDDSFLKNKKVTRSKMLETFMDELKDFINEKNRKDFIEKFESSKWYKMNEVFEKYELLEKYLNLKWRKFNKEVLSKLILTRECLRSFVAKFWRKTLTN